MTEGAIRSDDSYVGDWPTGLNKIETAKHVHAFGVIALNSAMLEESLLLLLIWYLRPIPHDQAMQLTKGMNNRQRLDWLRAVARAKELDEQVFNLVEHAIKCCDICFDNRNMLIHALYVRTDKVTANMEMTKRASNNPLREFRFEVSVDRLRQIADDIANIINFLLDLWFYHTHKPINALAGERLSLPKKPLQPNRLTIPLPTKDR